MLDYLKWSLIWAVFFWIFLIYNFPSEAARQYISHMLGKKLSASVEIKEIKIGWTLYTRIEGITVKKVNELNSGGKSDGGRFSLSLKSLAIDPSFLSLLLLKPDVVYSGDTESGGAFSGYYASDTVSLSFKSFTFKDISFPDIPVPSAATADGTGTFKVVKGSGSVDVEIDGIPGGKRRVKMPGGSGPGLTGRLKVNIGLPGL